MLIVSPMTMMHTCSIQLSFTPPFYDKGPRLTVMDYVSNFCIFLGTLHFISRIKSFSTGSIGHLG